ncbi:MAG: DUF2914 domain-containing protein [Candidatus Zambryskibacteria bacterium]|nr:DUF2914 domain-containing protein [Candidatus Zambryskibacteria bacterium]
MIRILTKKVTDWYGKYERPVSSLSLIGGFLFDILTLRRVDAFFENLWVLGHIVIVGTCMILLHAFEANSGDEKNSDKIHFWLVNIIQFFFGGILSVFLVFYFRSGDIAVSWPFILMLVLIFWANESLKRQYMRLTFQISLFFLSLFSTFIYLLPVILHSISDQIFIMSGLVSLIIITIFTYILFLVNKRKFYASRRGIIFSVGGIFLIFNFLYFTNLIPPLPLSLKDSGSYHLIQKDANNNYIASYEKTDWWRFFQVYGDVHIKPNEPLYAYSAVFSPTSLNTTIVHKWQFYNENLKQWIDSGNIELSVIGGREGGFRTYSKKVDLISGKWRVDVETLNGKLIGRLRFNIIISGASVSLETKTLD